MTLIVTVTGVLSTALLFLNPSLLFLDLLASTARVVLQVALLLLTPTVRWVSAPPSVPVGGVSDALSSPSCAAPLQTSRMSGTSST